MGAPLPHHSLHGLDDVGFCEHPAGITTKNNDKLRADVLMFYDRGTKARPNTVPQEISHPEKKQGKNTVRLSFGECKKFGSRNA